MCIPTACVFFAHPIYRLSENFVIFDIEPKMWCNKTIIHLIKKNATKFCFTTAAPNFLGFFQIKSNFHPSYMLYYVIACTKIIGYKARFITCNAKQMNFCLCVIIRLYDSILHGIKRYNVEFNYKIFLCQMIFDWFILIVAHTHRKK